MSRCQSKDIQFQYEKCNIRDFDIRLSFDSKTGEVEFRHGTMVYKGDVKAVFEFLNDKCDCSVRLIHESLKENVEHDNYFIDYCFYLATTFPNITFWGGYRKFDWKRLVSFNHDDLDYCQMVSSMTWKIWDDWFPWLYAHFMNKKNIESGCENKYMFIDFIDKEYK
jgi:hypothetical protein